MKKYIGSILGILTFMSVPLLSQCKRPLFIDNVSGWAITVTYTTIKNETKEIPIRQGEGFKEIGCIENIKDISFARRGQVWGVGAYSNSLAEPLLFFKRNIDKNKGYDAVILIEATRLGWNISGKWYKGGEVIAAEDIKEITFVTLDDIKKGDIGPEMAQKVNDILNADYSKAAKQGIVNLAHQLKRRFSDITFESVPLETPRKVGNQLVTTAKVEVLKPTSLTENEARQIIERVYKSFVSYRNKGLI